MFWFAIATLSPALLIAGASLWGGLLSYAALAMVTLVVIVLDRWTDVDVPELDEARAEVSGTRLSVALGGAHFIILPLGVWAIAASPLLTLPQAIALALALGLFLGQISHPNAHELIHRPGRRLRMLGRAIYTSMLFGHHASAHLRVHHVHVATQQDPNSPRPGEGFYRFWPRAWIGSFRAGLAAETRVRAGRAGWQHPYVGYCCGAAGALAMAAMLAGGRGVVVFVLVAAYAQMQLLLADYVQHYGLRRARRADGRVEPVGPQHSWNAPQWYSSAMLLNAPRHSDHHLHPGRCFPALKLDGATMPVLPRSMPVMCMIALIPPLWRQIMDPRAARWRQREWQDAP